ncbi:MAG: hypothetical protein U9R05_05395 [Chloroflexota bacterium]|nr:hypothetical protein [Chloroflexota bacterium]
MLVGLLLLSLGLGFLAHQEGWHQVILRGVMHPRETVTRWSRRAALPVLQIDLPFEEYQRLLHQREQARRLGLYVPRAQDVAAATVHYGGGNVAVELLWRAGRSTAESDGAWPLEVTVLEAPGIAGFSRLSLVPADAGYLFHWGYLATLRQAGLPTLHSSLVRLTLNGRSQGLYGLEELPVPTPERPILVGFDTRAYWAARADLRTLLNTSGFQYAQFQVWQSGEDEAVRQEILARLHAVQAGTLMPSALFDAEATGRFLAVTTLWYGAPTLDWRTLRWYYDVATDHLIPLSGGLCAAEVAPLPAFFTDDPRIQLAYVRALRRFSQPEALEELKIAFGEELETRWWIWGDLADAALPWARLEQHQRAMRAQLAPALPIVAYVADDPAGLRLELGNLQPLPVAVVGLDLGGNAFIPLKMEWVVEADRELLLAASETPTLRALTGAVPRLVSVRVPAEVLRSGDGEVAVLVRLVGPETPEILVPAQDAYPALPLPGAETQP